MEKGQLMDQRSSRDNRVSDVDMKYIRESKKMQFGQELFLVMHWRGDTGKNKVKLKKKILLASLNLASILFLVICYPDMHLK